MTNCNHKHGLELTCRHVHVRLDCFILTKACSCSLELAYFAGKRYKNRLACKNAVALGYCGSCRLLVRGSCLQLPHILVTAFSQTDLFLCGNRELTLKCKLKCYEKPMKDPLGVSPSKGNQGNTRGKEKFLLTSVGIEPTTCGLDL